jgi:hypothetical protein
MQPTGGGNPPINLGGIMESTIEQLQHNYVLALDALRDTPEYAAKEAAGAALQAAHEALKAERVAARVAAHAARLTNLTVVPVTETATEIPEQA